MKRFFRFFAAAVILLAAGLVLGGGLNPGSRAVVSAAQGPLVDGQVQPASVPEIPNQAAALPASVNAVTLYRSYAAYEFQSTHSNLTFASSGPALYALTLVPTYSFKLPLDLPNGAQVNNVTVFFADNSSTDNMSFQFYRSRLSDASQISLGSVYTTGLPTSAAVQSVTMTGSPLTVIDNFNYVYAIRYEPVITGDLHKLVGVRIEYYAPLAITYMPYVKK